MVYRWQYTKISSRRRVTATRKSDGLKGINCRHFFHGIFEDDPPNYTTDQLKELDERESALKPYETTNAKGEKVTRQYNSYQATQRQREMERVMRKTRLKIAGLKAAEQLDDAKIERRKYHGMIHEYERFSDKMGLQSQMQRVTADGLGRV